MYQYEVFKVRPTNLCAAVRAAKIIETAVCMTPVSGVSALVADPDGPATMESDVLKKSSNS